MADDNVIEFRVPPRDEYEPEWEKMARANPRWAARQIWGLLKRALESEAECDKMRRSLEEAKSFLVEHHAGPDHDRFDCSACCALMEIRKGLGEADDE